MLVHPTDQAVVVLKERIDTPRVQIDEVNAAPVVARRVNVDRLVVAPLAGFTQGRSQPHFAAIDTHFLNRGFNLRLLKILSMHQALLGTCRNTQPG